MTTLIRALAIALTAGLLGGVPAVVAAQEAPQAPAESVPPRAGRPAARGMRMGRPALPANPEVMTAQQVEDYFENIVLYQAQSQLSLTNEQFLRFGQGLKRLQMARRQQQRRKMVLLRDLNQLLAVQPFDEAGVTAKLKDIDDSAAEYNRQVQDAYAAIDHVLDLKQRARFRIFDENMERRKLDLLARARQAAAAPAAEKPAQ